MPRRQCSIIVPVYNRVSLTDHCVRRLLGEAHANTEIIVVDDASHDSTPETLASYGDRIRVVRHNVNAGFAASCNDGADAAHGDYLVFLNNDTYPLRGWLDALAAYADAHPEAAAVGAKLLHPNGTVQHAGVVITAERIPRHIYTGFPRDHPAVNKSRRFQAVTAAAVLVRRDPFLEAGGFDTTFVNSYEDIDLCLRLGGMGYEIHYCHAAVIEHLDTVSRDFRDHDFNQAIFLRRWQDRIEPDDFAYYIEDGLLEPEYWEQYPIGLRVSPLLATLRDDNGDDRDALLAQRSRQVFELMRENVRVKADLLDLRREMDRPVLHDAAPPWRTAIRDGAAPLAFPRHPEPLVSIVIPVHNNWDYTYACLQSVLAHSGSVPYEVIVADDASGDETARIDDIVRNVIVKRNPEPHGFLQNCNEAAALARGDYIVFLNNDTMVTEGWLKRLVEVLEDDPKVAVVGPKLVYPTGRLQEAGAIIWADGTGWNYGRFDDPEKAEYDHGREVDYVSGACLVVRASFWSDVGGFDEEFAPGYYEDADICFAARERGLAVRYEPQATVVHYEGISHGRDLTAGVKQHEASNRSKFVAKWAETLARNHFAPGKEVFRARDRSARRGIALVIDHYVPQYDKDAGSRATWHYLHLLKELQYGVVFVPGDFHPTQPYTDELKAAGITVLHGPWYADNIRAWLRENGDSFDYIQLHRPQIAWRYIDLLRTSAPSATIAFVPVDLHHVRELRRFKALGTPEALAEAERLKSVEFEIVAKADLVYVFSDAEEKLLRKAFPYKPVRTIPVNVFEPPTLDQLSLRDRDHILFVGGFHHPPNADAVRWFTREVLPQLRREMPNVRFVIAGSHPPPEVTELGGDGVEVTGFVSDERLWELYAGARVVVAPLLYGAGAKGKIVEALAHGVPVVTTHIGAEGIDPAESALAVADEPEAFAAAVAALHRDEKRWHEVSRAARAYIAAHYSRDAAIAVLEEDLPPAPSDRSEATLQEAGGR